MKKSVPIFPLNLVLFPGAQYALHIFEERYKLMIEHCMNNNLMFGIVSKIKSEISTIGCLCKIIKILKHYPTGQKDILVQGFNRFQIVSTSMHADGYLEAVYTEYIDSSNLIIDEIKMEQATIKFKNLIGKTNLKLEQGFWDNLYNTKFKSYKIAEKSGLNLNQQQNLLMLTDENKRLQYIIRHLEKIEKYLDEQVYIQNLIANDGYMN